MRFLCALACLVGIAMPVLAEDCQAPCIGTTLTIENTGEWIRLPRSGLKSSVLLDPHVELETYLMPVENLKLVSNLTLERVIDPLPGANSAYEDLGGYVAELYAELALDPVTLKVGKFDPVFSLISDVGSGIHSADLAENLDMSGVIVGQSSVAFDALGLKQAVTAAVFSTDRTLAKSVFTKRPVTKLSDGGAGNIKGLSSFQVMFDGCMGAEPDACHDDGVFGYRLGARYQRHGRPFPVEDGEDPIKPENETALLYAMSGNVDLGDMTLRLLGEEAYLRHIGGSPDDALILTGQLALVDGPLTYSGTLSRQWNYIKAAPDVTENLAELAVEYAPEEPLFVDGASWTVAASYAYARDDTKQVSHTLALKLTFDLSGSQSLR
jgi:hypothetical protein